MEKKKRNLDWVGKKRDFQYSGKPFYINFIPKEKIESLSDEEYSKHSSYRRNYFEYYKGFEDIERKKKEIKQIQQKQKVWKSKMMEGYSVIGYLGEDYDFNCSVNLREIKPKPSKGERMDYDTSVPYSDGRKMGRDTNNTHNKMFSEWKLKHDKVDDKKLFMDKLEEERREKNKKGYPKKYYVRIEPKSRSKFKDNQWIRNLYVGMKDEVIHLLKTSSPNTDWDKVSESKLRDNLREIYKGYIRFQIYTNGLDCVKIGYNTKKGKEENPQSQHPSDKVMDWIKEVGTDIVEWMDK
ncbi:hypothetical protein N9L07_01375 [Flavobacteriaceae bacterium]|nr:hypothetical protein [Flavobacteriaceae bacterium]